MWKRGSCWSITLVLLGVIISILITVFSFCIKSQWILIIWKLLSVCLNTVWNGFLVVEFLYYEQFLISFACAIYWLLCITVVSNFAVDSYHFQSVCLCKLLVAQRSIAHHSGLLIFAIDSEYFRSVLSCAS
jgi:hypothetical protein